jgi:hypothetical protein
VSGQPVSRGQGPEASVKRAANPAAAASLFRSTNWHEGSSGGAPMILLPFQAAFSTNGVTLQISRRAQAISASSATRRSCRTNAGPRRSPQRVSHKMVAAEKSGPAAATLNAALVKISGRITPGRSVGRGLVCSKDHTPHFPTTRAERALCFIFARVWRRWSRSAFDRPRLPWVFWS